MCLLPKLAKISSLSRIRLNRFMFRLPIDVVVVSRKPIIRIKHCPSKLAKVLKLLINCTTIWQLDHHHSLLLRRVE